MPQTTTARELQRNYRTLFNRIKLKQEPLVVLNKNQPEVVILDIQTFESLQVNKEQFEQAQARLALRNYLAEKNRDKLKILRSLKDLTHAR